MGWGDLESELTHLPEKCIALKALTPFVMSGLRVSSVAYNALILCVWLQFGHKLSAEGANPDGNRH